MSKMKILTLDIETSPNLTWAWNSQLWNSPIPYNYIVEPSRMITWAAKWEGKKTVYFRSEDQEDFLTLLWELMDKADVCVGYNSRRFDRKYLNSHFIEEGMDPPTQVHDIDLYPIIKRHFMYPSYKLVYVADVLLGHTKMENAGAELWFAYMDGESWAKKQMKEYNMQDVEVTEELYKKVRGWITNHPNHGLYVEDQENPVCRNCSSENVKKNGTEYDTTGLFAYERYRCNDCGANLRGREAMKGKKAVSLQLVK